MPTNSIHDAEKLVSSSALLVSAVNDGKEWSGPADRDLPLSVVQVAITMDPMRLQLLRLSIVLDLAARLRLSQVFGQSAVAESELGREIEGFLNF